MENRRTAFIGVGNMAGALLSGAIQSGCLISDRIILFDKFPSQYEKFHQDGVHISTATSAAAAVRSADVVILSAKPQNLPEIAQELASCELGGKLFISIMAGIRIASICKAFGQDIPVVRVIPNTPMLVGRGVSALCRNALVGDDDFRFAEGLFAASGVTVLLDEDEINRITAVTSSAVAYVALFIRAIADGSRQFGLEPDNLLALVSETVIGSAELMMQKNMTPEELIKMVASPKGTTEKALDVFHASDFSNVVADAMDACAKRADELSKLI